LLVALGVAALQDAPGYMDADYYFYGGQRLADGHEFTEMVLWNYLDDPNGLPHPSHTYWMPLTSIIAALGIMIFRFLGDFNAAQAGFILIFAAIPPLTAALSMKIIGESRKAFFAGILALFSGYFLPVLTTTESFGLYMLLGGAFFLFVQLKFKRRFFVLGVLSGLMHLTRADGLIWLFIAGVVLLFDQQDEFPNGSILKGERSSPKFFMQIGEILIGYLIIMAGWYLRNLNLFGSLFPPGGGATLWMLNYDELFSYPASLLSFDRWWALGLGEIINARWKALGLNLLSGFAVQGIFIIGPIAFLGARKHRGSEAIKVGWIAWLLILGIMTIIFPDSGVRGGFFHSGAAFMPLLWAMVPEGLEVLSNWTVTKYNWEVKRISPFFHGVVVLLVIIISLWQVNSKLLRNDPTSQSVWSVEIREYSNLEERLLELGATSDDIVLVNNPPGYAHVSGRSAIVIPNGDVETLMMVVDRYKPRYVLLGINRPRGLNDLYQNPENLPRLTFLETVSDTHIFIVEEGPP